MTELHQLSLGEKTKNSVLTIRQKLFIYPVALGMAMFAVYLLAFGGDNLEALAVERLDVQRDWYNLDDQRSDKQDQIDALEAEIAEIEENMRSKEARAAEIDQSIKSVLEGKDTSFQ